MRIGITGSWREKDRGSWGLRSDLKCFGEACHQLGSPSRTAGASSTWRHTRQQFVADLDALITVGGGGRGWDLSGRIGTAVNPETTGSNRRVRRRELPFAGGPAEAISRCRATSSPLTTDATSGSNQTLRQSIPRNRDPLPAVIDYQANRYIGSVTIGLATSAAFMTTTVADEVGLPSAPAAVMTRR
jgi:hypothetical protein